MEGLILNVQRFSIHDGRGIRTTVFMKGCSMRCRWCHNPESIYQRKQLSYNRDKCTLCGSCVAYIDDGNLRIVDGELLVDANRYKDRVDLVDICPFGAYDVYGSYIKSKDLVEVLFKDYAYYKESDGGITFSGGEALNQWPFIKEVILEINKKEPLHITLDISGFNPLPLLEDTLSYVDEYLVDIKYTGSTKGEIEFIGQNLDLDPLLSLLSSHNKSVVLRGPIIKGVNDNIEHFKRMVSYQKKYSNIRYVDILPYHNLKKRMETFSPVDIKEFPSVSSEDKSRWKDILDNLGCRRYKIEGVEVIK